MTELHDVELKGEGSFRVDAGFRWRDTPLKSLGHPLRCGSQLDHWFLLLQLLGVGLSVSAAVDPC